MTQNLLNSNNDPVQQLDPEKKYVEELVGENKKFKDIESLARGKYEADAYIAHQNKQLDELKSDYFKLKADYEARAKLEEYIDQMSNRKDQQLPPNTQTNEDKPQQYNPEEVKSLVDKSIIDYENKKRQDENFNTVQRKLTERYGDNYQPVLKKHMDELGMSDEHLNSMARTNPKLLIKALGLDTPPQTENFQTPPRSMQRSDNFAPSTNKRTWTYYEKLRKEQPNVYWTPRTQDQLFKDQSQIGDAFFDGDFNR